MENRWIWPFELKEKIGQGGMGVVYRARYVKNDREVAVKLLPPEIAADKKIAMRFERELEVLKKLKHPNIVYCFGGKCEGDQHFYAMELVEGGSMERLLKKRGRLQWEQVCEYMLQLCSALYFAHEHGFVHRDVKPGNLLLTEMNKVKLSDFGLARARSDAGLTEHGKTMGTFHYMAPEQIRGKPPLSASTDLYAMGCVMYELLAGRPPFRGHTPAEILQKHLEQAPPPVSANAMDCPAALEQLIQDLLAKKQENRPENAMEVAKRLKQILERTPLDKTTRDITVRHTMAAQVIDDAITSPAIRRPTEGAQPSWISSALLGGVLLIIGLLIWNAYAVGQSNSTGQAGEMWVKALESREIPVRVAAAENLANLRPITEEAVNALARVVKEDEIGQVRQAAAESLGKLGPAAESAKGELNHAKSFDSDAGVQFKAQAALEAINSGEDASQTRSTWPYYLTVVLILLAGIGYYVVRGVMKTMK